MAEPSYSLLAFETATEDCSVALVHEQQVLYETAFAGQIHSEMILPMINRILKQANIALNQLDAIAFGAGPGSFTGLRIACGVAQGLGFAGNIPVIPIPSLEALAYSKSHTVTEKGQNILTAIDARMGEIYIAHYKISFPQKIECIRPAEVIKPAMLIEQFKGISFDYLLGDAWKNFPELTVWANKHARKIDAASMPDAIQIAQIATTYFKQGKTVKAENASPFYVRNRIALTTEERAIGARL